MTQQRNAVLAGFALVLFTALVLAAASPAKDSRGVADSVQAGKSSTKVTIAAWGKGVFGYVKTSKASKCAAGRSVRVLRRSGKGTKRIGTATARRNHGRYQWSLKTNRSSGVFAKTKKKPGCPRAKSARLPETAGGDVPDCPSNAAVCHFPNMHGDMVEFRLCPGFSAASGSCSGDSEGGVAPWAPNNKAIFGWSGRPDGPRDAWYYAKYSVDDEHTAVAASLVGSVPNPGSANFTIADASDPHGPADTKDTHWYTPDVPGAAPGSQGGPMYLDFENGSWGFDIYIRGYLYKK